MYKETLFVERSGKTTADSSYFAGTYKGFSMSLFSYLSIEDKFDKCCTSFSDMLFLTHPLSFYSSFAFYLCLKIYIAP